VIKAVPDPKTGGAPSGDRNQAAIFAMEGLAKIGPAAQDAVPALIMVLKIDEKTITNRNSLLTATITALGAIGPPAEPALPLLRPFLITSNFGKTAERAIEKIKGEFKGK